MNIKLSNQILFDQKIHDLDKFKNEMSLQALEHSFSCVYHGINLNFKTKSTSFIDSLKSFIPKEWIGNQSEDTVIYLISPAEFGYSAEEWSDEFSQDCVSYENNTLVVQRDFAACLYDNQVFLICEDSVGDGFYNFLRWYLSEKLMGLNKYVLHASCVLDKKKKVVSDITFAQVVDIVDPEDSNYKIDPLNKQLSKAKSYAFQNPQWIIDEIWTKAAIPSDVFSGVDALAIVDQKGYRIIPAEQFDDVLQFVHITQGKPKFKVL